MKKKRGFHGLVSCYLQIFIKMKLTVLALLLSFAGAWASSGYAQTTRLTVEARNLRLEEFFRKIEDQSEYRFFYSVKINVERTVNGSFENSLIADVLDDILKNTDIKYEVKGKQIILSPLESPTATEQKQKSVSGKITDSSGATIPGVSVVVKGTTLGVITDSEGKYTLSSIPENGVLQFSFVGMKTQEIKVGAQATINVVLAEETVGIEEVVAIGYGTQSTAKLTTSVSKVETTLMQNTAFSNNGAALSGLTQGIILRQFGGGPGNDTPTISIRGGGEPLYVIDGIISPKESFTRLNPSDIESISILKDAGAAAIYGSRASEGVVLVNTISSKKDKISYSNNFSWADPATKPEMLSAIEYIQFYNKVANAIGGTPYSDTEVEKWKNGTDPGYQSWNFMQQAFKKYASSQRHNLTISGKEKNSDYMISVSAQDQGSQFLYDDTHFSNTYNVLAKIGKTYEKLGITFNAKLSASFRDFKTTSFGYYATYKSANESLPIWQPFNSKGNYLQINGIFNPFYQQDPNNGYQLIKNRRYSATSTLKWVVPKVKGLDITFTGNFETDLYHEKKFTSNQPFYTTDNNPIYQALPDLYEAKNNSQNYTIQSSINYKNVFGKHRIESSLIYEESNYGIWNMGATRKDYMSQVLDNLSFGSPTGLTNSGTMDESARRGYIGRLMYDYFDRYLITGSFRYDASERFRPADRWGLFPSVSLGWRLSKEPFIEEILSRVLISNMKLRLSYGEVGNDNIARFAYLATYGVTDKRYFNNGQWFTGIYDNGLPAGDISWYTQKSYNIGLDMDLFKNRLETTFDAFYYRTSGFLASPAATYTTPLGTALPQINNGSQRRGGYELAVNWKDKINDFNYSIGANLTHYETIWEENPGEALTTLKNPYTRTTQVSGTYYTLGYITQGYYKDMADVLNSPRLEGQVDILPGDLKYVDVNGDGKINAEDQRRIGTGTFPKFYFGLQFKAKYKGFNLDAVFQGATTYNLPNWQIGSWNKAERGAATFTRKQLTDVWTPDNPNARYPRLNLTNGRTADIGSMSDFWLLDASYCRLKNVQFGYDFKYSLLKKWDVIQGFYVYLSGTNLLTIAPGLDKLYDPESASDGNMTDYPIERTFSFGINIDF